jgi:hypothetical protein
MAPPVSCQCRCQCQRGDKKYHVPLTRRRASIVSVDSILSDTPGEVLGASEALRSADLRAKGATSSLVIERGEDRTFGSPCHGTDLPFPRHDKYFFNDGNVTFLVGGLVSAIYHAYLIHTLDCRSMAHFIASIDIFSPATRDTSPIDFPYSKSMTMKSSPPFR